MLHLKRLRVSCVYVLCIGFYLFCNSGKELVGNGWFLQPNYGGFYSPVVNDPNTESLLLTKVLSLVGSKSVFMPLCLHIYA